MNTTIPVKYDYFIGRKVVGISKTKNKWDIELEGGVKLVNHDSSIPAPDIATGYHLALIDEVNDVLWFNDGRQQSMHVKFNLAKGMIFHPEVGKELKPQIEDEDLGTPPDPSADRVADGPLDPEEDSDNADEE